MERKTEHLHILVEPSLVQAIDEWSWQQRVRTRADAIRQLVQIGMKASEAETKKADATAS